MKVQGLKSELKKSGLDCNGTKMVLRSRLIEGLKNGVLVLDNISKSKTANITEVGFTSDAHWEDWYVMVNPSLKKLEMDFEHP